MGNDNVNMEPNDKGKVSQKQNEYTEIYAWGGWYWYNNL